MPGKVVISIPHIFDRAQRTKANHQKGKTGLLKLQKLDPQQFTNEFMFELKRILSVKRKETCVERFLEFVVSFAVQTPIPVQQGDQEMPFVVFLLESFLPLCRASNAYVKFWSCYIIAALLCQFPEDIELDEELSAKILSVMINERAFDTAVRTRVEAIKALGRLQDSSNPKCPVMPAFLLLLVHDQNVSVRKVVLETINITKASIDAIIGRTRDVSKEVRKYAFEILALKVDIQMLKVEQRVQLLDAGLNDRERTVRNECYKLLQNWHQFCGGDPIKLLQYFCVEVYEKVAVDVIQAILFYHNIDQKSHHDVIDKLEEAIAQKIQEPLSNELCIFWRVFVEEQIAAAIENGTNDEPCVQTFTDLEITQFCMLIKAQIGAEGTDFSQLQLLKLAKHLDLSDEAGRRMLSILLSELIISPETSTEMLIQTVDLLRLVHPNDTEFIQTILTNIQVISNPLEEFRADDKIRVFEEKLANLQGDANELLKQRKREKDKARKEHLDTLIRNIQEEARPIEEQLHMYDQVQQYVLSRCLDTLCLLFERCPPSVRYPDIQELEATILKEAIQIDQSSDVLKAAIDCITHLTIESKEKCTKYLPIYQKILLGHAENEFDTIVLVSTLRGFFDICTWYGVEFIQNMFEASEFTEIMENLMEFLDFDGKENFQRMVDLQDRLKFVYEQYTSDDIDYDDPVRCKELQRSIAAEGFAKLILLDRIDAGNSFYDEILFRLIILFYSPDTMHQYLIRQCLTVFFSAYSSAPQPHHLQAIKRMLVRCFLAVLHAESEAVAHIDNLQLCSFLLSLIQPTADAAQFELRCSLHHEAAVAFAEEIITYCNDFSAQQLCNLASLLNQCALVNCKFEALDQLLQKVVTAAAEVPQVQVRKPLLKCKVVIEKLIAETDPPTESDDEEESDAENIVPANEEDSSVKVSMDCISLKMENMRLDEEISLHT